MPAFTLLFCAIIVTVFVLDHFFLLPKSARISLKEKLLTGHNKGRLNRVLRLDDRKIKKGEVWRLVSSSLLHVGPFHLISNLAAMLIVGFAVEPRLGAVKTMLCYVVSTLVSGLFMTFVYQLHEGEGASPGIYGLIAVFAVLALKNGTVLFSGLPLYALILLAIYTVGGLFSQKATLFEHLSGFAGGLLITALVV